MSEEIDDNFGFNEDYYDGLVKENKKLREVVKDLSRVLIGITLAENDIELIDSVEILMKHEQFLKSIDTINENMEIKNNFNPLPDDYQLDN